MCILKLKVLGVEKGGGNVFTILSLARFVTNTFTELSTLKHTQGITDAQTIAKVWVKHTHSQPLDYNLLLVDKEITNI